MIPFHPYADLFPLIEGPDFDELVADIRAKRLQSKIEIYQGRIIDGRNRYRACCVIKPDFSRTTDPLCFADYGGTDPLGYVISRNLARRHLNESQRAMVAADLSRLRQGTRTDLPSVRARMDLSAACAHLSDHDNLSPGGERSQAERAALVHVGKRTVERAEVVVDRAVPEVAAAVRRGVLPVSTAAELADLPAERQREIIAASPLAPARPALVEIAKHKRAAREATEGARLQALPAIKAGVILEDFEWHHETWGDGGEQKHPGNHYETARDALTPEEIVARSAERFGCADDNCVLFMWCTGPHLWIALQVMALRGFNYKSHIVWDKQKMITGYWARYRHEILLIGTRGKVVAPAMGTQPESIVTEKGREHSRKPEWQYELIERWYPNVPKLELNARHRRPGWISWGNGLPDDERVEGSPETIRAEMERLQTEGTG